MTFAAFSNQAQVTAKSGYGGVMTASADETAARLIISPIAEITNMRSMAALHYR
jgi:hypothetical protein